MSVETIKMLAFCGRVLRNRTKNDADVAGDLEEAESSEEDEEEPEEDADIYESEGEQ